MTGILRDTRDLTGLLFGCRGFDDGENEAEVKQHPLFAWSKTDRKPFARWVHCHDKISHPPICVHDVLMICVDAPGAPR